MALEIVRRDKQTICQVLHSLEVGGAEMLAARLARQLRGEYEFVFACLDGIGTLGESLRSEGFRVENLGRRDGLDLACVRRLAGFVRQHRAALIHAHQYTPFFYSRAPGWLGRRPPVLFTEHGRFHPDLPSRKRMMFNHLFLRQEDRVVAVGDAVKQALINNEGIPAGRIEVIYNGVPLDDFRRDEATRLAVRGELGLAPQTPLAILVARLDYLKDHATALRTAARVRQAIPDFQLLLVGEGPERPKIEALLAELKLDNSVRLLGLRTDIRRLLAAADVFLLTSISEGIPVTLIEAMAAELPIVATAVGGVAEVVTSGESGFLAPAGDDPALSAAIVQLLGSKDLRQTLAACGRSAAIAQFSEAGMHRKYVEHYRSMPRRVKSAEPCLA